MINAAENEEGAPELSAEQQQLEELRGMKLGAVQKRAEDVGVAKAEIEDADDKAGVIELIQAKQRAGGAAAAEGTPPPPLSKQQRAELEDMNLRGLQKRAEAVGVDQQKLDDSDAKSDIIELIADQLREEEAARVRRVELLLKFGPDSMPASPRLQLSPRHGRGASPRTPRSGSMDDAQSAELAETVAGLWGLKLQALQTLAEDNGVDCRDASDKAEMIELIRTKLEQQGSAGSPRPGSLGSIGGPPPLPLSAKHLDEFRKLEEMNLRAVQKRAEEVGVDKQRLDDAEEKSDLIALVAAKLQEDAAAEIRRLAERKEQLESMKLGALQERATSVGVDTELLDAAEKRIDIVKLILDKEAEAEADAAKTGPAGSYEFGFSWTVLEEVLFKTLIAITILFVALRQLEGDGEEQLPWPVAAVAGRRWSLALLANLALYVGAAFMAKR